ncbi:MAG: polysaccharide deacetylase family protein [Butyricicoccus sp.]
MRKPKKGQWRLEAAFLAGLILFAVVGASVEQRLARPVSAQDTAVPLPVAMYHSVTDQGESPGEYVISPSMLEKDLQWLSQHGYETVVVGDLVSHVENGTPLPEKPVMLTFDDGYYNNYRNAYPLLQKYGMQAVLSPVGTLVEQFTETDDPEEHEVWSYCTSGELQEMAASGVVEIQNHSYDFHELTPRRGCLRKSGEDEATYRNIFFEDTRKAQELFRSIGISPPVCYTYPYGARNTETDALVQEYGFVASLSCEEGITCITRDAASLKNIRRYNRDGRISSEQFWQKVLGQLEEVS